MTTKNSPTHALREQATRIVDELKAVPKPRAKPTVKFAIAMDGMGRALDIKSVEWTWAHIDETPRALLVMQVIDEMRK